MALELTRRQFQVKQAYKDLLEKNGYVPTLREIAAHLGLSSVGNIHRIVKDLEARGHIKRGDTRADLEVL